MRDPRRRRRRSLLVAALAAALVVTCSDPDRGPPADNGPALPLEVLSVDAAQPLLPGSPVIVRAGGLEAEGDSLLLDLRARDGEGAVALAARGEPDPGGEVEFQVDPGVFAVYGAGEHDLLLTLLEGERASAPLEVRWALVEALPISLDSFPGGRVFRNEEVVLSGGGFVTPEEARVEAELRGVFTSVTGSTVQVAERLPVRPAERLRRDRGVVRLSTAIGGLEPGRFEGTAELFAEGASYASRSGTVPAAIEFASPSLFEMTPDSVALGQVVTLRGGGFLGSPEESDEATLLRFEGHFTTEAGIELGFGPAEAVLGYESGDEARFGIEVAARGQGLVSDFFGHRRGVFEGDVTVVTLQGNREWAAEPLSVGLEVAGVVQVIHITFLPGFYDSLRHFGLASAAAELPRRVRDRVQSIYADYAVEVVLERPEDFLPNAYSLVEIGGPDPNGLGLLGYDNTPGKDVGNLRLFDRIGGANADTQADGFPGYGGVFIESFLYWSERPALSGERPFGSPPPDPLFDEIFDPVRQRPASLAEVEGAGSAARVAEVERAVAALGNMIGETTAHEIGHSLGLAQPFGPADAFHTPFPGEGCLMDAGGSRPLGERAGEPGFAASRFCHDEPEYLGQILPRHP